MLCLCRFRTLTGSGRGCGVTTTNMRASAAPQPPHTRARRHTFKCEAPQEVRVRHERLGDDAPRDHVHRAERMHVVVRADELRRGLEPAVIRLAEHRAVLHAADVLRAHAVPLRRGRRQAQGRQVYVVVGLDDPARVVARVRGAVKPERLLDHACAA